MKDDEAFIPRSACINFTIKSNKTTSETNEFKELVEANNALVADTKKKFRDNIIASLAIEIQQQITKITEQIIEAINLCAKILLIEQSESIDLALLATRSSFAILLPLLTE